ncbi:MAG: NUDIX hydrolase [Verrucomicrobia bacterium]|nr:NUDIX hydrolase [Verrucomicrobiota bacterium]
MKTVSRRLLCQPNKFLALELHELELADGKRIADWPWVITPDYVNVLVVTTDRRFLCFRQTKYAFDGDSLAPVGGYIEPGEAPLAAAQRELLEETGYISEEWSSLGSYVVDANRGCGTAHLFLALNARFERPPVADDLEAQELLLLSRNEIQAALQAGQFKVLAWAALVSAGLQRLDARR